MRNPLAPIKDAYSCAIAAVSLGAMDINGNLIDPSKLSDSLLQDMIDLAVEGNSLVNELLNEQQRRNA